jgi:dihydrofolate reductase
MNSISKIVFSKTLDKAEWINTKLIKENVVDEILKLKQLPGKDIAVFGSSDLSLILLQHGLIDEIRVLINPVVIGNGKTIFTGINEKLKLKLLKTKSFESGNVMIYYNPIKL